MPAPSRLSENNFRFYEEVIQAAVQSAPQIILINPDEFNRTIGTFIARLRDAMLAFSTSDFDSRIDYDRFMYLRKQNRMVAKEVQVDGQWYVALGSPQGERIFFKRNSFDTKQSAELVVHTYHDDVIRSIIILKFHKVLVNPVRFLTFPNDIHTHLESAGVEYFYDNNNLIIP